MVKTYDLKTANRQPGGSCCGILSDLSEMWLDRGAASAMNITRPLSGSAAANEREASRTFRAYGRDANGTRSQ